MEIILIETFKSSDGINTANAVQAKTGKDKAQSKYKAPLCKEKHPSWVPAHSGDFFEK